MVVVKEVAGAEAIAARAQPPGKGGNIASLKNCEIQFVWDGNLLRTFWELWSFATKNVGFEHRAQKYYPKHVYRRKKIPGQKGGPGPPGRNINPPLIQALDLLLIHPQNVNWIMHGSILPVAMPPGHTGPRGFAIFFFLGGLFPTPGHVERDNSPPPSSWSTSYTFFATSFWSVQKQNDTFSQLLWTFSWVFLREG